MNPTKEQLTAVVINISYLIFMMFNPTGPIVAGYLIVSLVTAGLYYLNFSSISNRTMMSHMNQLSEQVAKEMAAAQNGRLQLRERLTEIETKISDVELLKTELSNIRMSIRR